MSINYAMPGRNRIFIFLLFLMLSAAANSAPALSTENETTLTEESDSKEVKVDKKKDKDKEVIDISDRFFITLAIDVALVLLIILLIYYPMYKNKDTIFTFILFNIVIFLLTFVLNKVKISMGAAFGLFAVFSMLRYRTAGIGMKDMTYLFIFIALGLLSGIQLEYWKLIIIGGIIFIVTFILDCNFILKRELSKNIKYEKIDLARPEMRAELIEDLKKRTGLKINRVVINKLDYLKDTAYIRIYYYE